MQNSVFLIISYQYLIVYTSASLIGLHVDISLTVAFCFPLIMPAVNAIHPPPPPHPTLREQDFPVYFISYDSIVNEYTGV